MEHQTINAWMRCYGRPQHAHYKIHISRRAISVADDLPCTEILYRGEVDLAFIGLEFRDVGSPYPVRFLYIEIPGKNILCHFSHVTFVRGVLLLRLDHSGYQIQFLHDPAYLLMVDCQPFIPEGEANPSESIDTSGISKYFLYSFP